MSLGLYATEFSVKDMQETTELTIVHQLHNRFGWEGLSSICRTLWWILLVFPAFNFLAARCLASGVLNNDKNCSLVSTLDAWGVLLVKVIYHVRGLFLKALANFTICLSSAMTCFASHVDSQTNQVTYEDKQIAQFTISLSKRALTWYMTFSERTPWATKEKIKVQFLSFFKTPDAKHLAAKKLKTTSQNSGETVHNYE